MYLTKCPILVLTDPGQSGKFFFYNPGFKITNLSLRKIASCETTR